MLDERFNPRLIEVGLIAAVKDGTYPGAVQQTLQFVDISTDKETVSPTTSWYAEVVQPESGFLSDPWMDAEFNSFIDEFHDLGIEIGYEPEGGPSKEEQSSSPEAPDVEPSPDIYPETIPFNGEEEPSQIISGLASTWPMYVRYIGFRTLSRMPSPPELRRREYALESRAPRQTVSQYYEKLDFSPYSEGMKEAVGKGRSLPKRLRRKVREPD